MNEVPGFLLALGLRPDADERAIRRSYATELKKIDQETDAQAFQRLRETYEAALFWVRNRPPANAPSPAPVVPEVQEPQKELAPQIDRIDPAPVQPLIETPRPASPHENAHEVVEAFANRLVKNPLSSIDDAAMLLNVALEDDRLLDMDARFLFEANVAHILAGGWQPGHEHLFEAACEAFEWRKDSSRLQRLGQAGHVVDAAIVEQHAHADLPPAHRELQLKYLDLLRRRHNPGEEAVALGLDHVLHAASLFPNWVRLTSKTGNIAAWQQINADAASSTFRPSPRRTAPAAATSRVPLKPSQLVAWFAIFCVGLMLFVLLQSFLKWQGARMPASEPLVSQAVRPVPSASPATVIPTSPTSSTFAPAATPPRASIASPDVPTAEYSVAPRPVYPPMSKRLGEQGKVLVKVIPDSDGIVRGIRVAQSSGYERLDAAAVDAVKAARLIVPPIKAEKTSATWYMAPINFVLTDGAKPPARKDWSQMVAAAVRPNIVLAVEVQGNPVVEFILDLAPNGKILNTVLSKSSGVPEWDNAALRAIRKTEYMPLPDQGKLPPQMVLALRPKNQ
ncbi:protein TonB [Variovorax boronicumulans]|uniref:Protein TonB n=1 Tax=Variovorax boronicumulans TaxID=436515 RepID=A0AAW8D3G2_9BURK|nr:TonB family protein [Variovorax boronicumulans]MDP9894537.1 protein TonB [Variovorax boronicumulans]MDQ0054356.1 protein TonB [Variovorax boronicumulans]